MSLKTFTYSQYIKCIHTFRLNAVMQLADGMTEYKLENTKEKYLQGELLKSILQDKKEVAGFINQFVEPREKIRQEDLIHYTASNYITKRYRTKEADFVYKLKNKDVFFLLECQDKIDNKIDYKLLNYCLDIMREWTQNRKSKKVTSYPMIVPILIYTGKQKWKILKEEKEDYGEEYALEGNNPNFEYNFVDMNKFPKQVLLEKGSMLSYAMFLEKSEGMDELTQNLESIIASTVDKRKLIELFSMVRHILSHTLTEQSQGELLNKIEKKVIEGK